MEARFERFTVLIAKIHRCIYKIKTEEMAEFNLKSSHVSCLYYLYKENGLTAKELCDVCGEDKANISRAVKYLEGNGYVYCDSALQKRYQSVLRLTERGKEVGKHVAEKIDNVLFSASEGLNEADRVIMYKSLALVCDNLEKICKNYGE